MNKKNDEVFRLLGGEVIISSRNDDDDQSPNNNYTQNILDIDNQIRIAELLKKWGKDLSCVESCKEATKTVEEHRQKEGNRNNKELFVFNPYRPQGGQGFKGTAMWTSLLAETNNIENENQNEDEKEMRRRMAKIFRVDVEFNQKVNDELKRQDLVCEAVANEMLSSSNKS